MNWIQGASILANGAILAAMGYARETNLRRYEAGLTLLGYAAGGIAVLVLAFLGWPRFPDGSLNPILVGFVVLALAAGPWATWLYWRRYLRAR